MEERKNRKMGRGAFQGVLNILRFNWHFYVLSLVVMLALIKFSVVLSLLMLLVLVITLAVSYYIYDKSDLYTLKWLRLSPESMINIHAGFDETSALLREKYPDASLAVYDFYDPKLHTEVSIKRARKAYPPYPDTLPISTKALQLGEESIDAIFLIFAAHEIRNDEERVIFFKQLAKALTSQGSIVVTEHLRDLPNLLAYNIGAFHFLSPSTWEHTFKQAGLQVQERFHITPFVTTFILSSYGVAS
jgi:hypothetical protein